MYVLFSHSDWGSSMSYNKKKFFSIILIILVIFLNFIIINIPVSSEKNRNNIFYVGGSDPGNYTYIQDAINDSDSGDTIFVYYNTYFENVLINKEIKLLSKNNDYPIIDGQSIGSVVNITASGVEFKGFIIMHSGECTPELYAGINIEGGNALVADNNITRNSAYGIRINSSNNIIKDNAIKHNCGEGIYTTDLAKNNIIYNNYLLDNIVDNGNNIWNISITPGINILGGPNLGGNYWHDYQGLDFNSDGLGDTNLPHNNSGNIPIGGDYHPLSSEIYVTTISKNWNYISIPLNTSYNKYDLLIYHNDNKYTWDESTTNNNPTGQPFLNSFIFDWDRSLQTYIFTDILQPGHGYWIYGYQPCEIRINITPFIIDHYITTVQKGWNIISIPFSQYIDISDLIISNATVTLTWEEAVNNNMINQFVMGWNNNLQSYQFATQLKPGKSYWLYSYQKCTLKRNY
jgi:hypothetical protein